MPRVKEQSDEVILGLALKVIIQKGPTTFSLADVSEEAGLSPATLLQRFGSKTGLLKQALTHSNGLMLKDLNTVLARVSASRTSGLKAVIDLLLNFAKVFKKPEQVAQGLDILKLDILDPDLNKVSVEYFQIRKRCVLALLVRAKESGELAKSTNLEDLANCLESVWQGTILQWALLKDGQLAPHLRRNLETVLRRKG